MDFNNIEELAEFYIRIYKDTNPKEKWNTGSAKNL